MELILVILIAGAGLAAATLAFELRRLGVGAPIAIVGDEASDPYERPPLSKDILLGRKSVDSLSIRSRADYTAQNIDLLTGARITSADTDEATIQLADGRRIGWDMLIIATGVRNSSPPILGLHAVKVHQLRTVDDALALRKAAVTGSSVACVGMGFIGAEVAAALRTLGSEVWGIDSQPAPLWRAFGATVSADLLSLHEYHGVNFIGEQIVQSIFPGPGKQLEISMSGGSNLLVDFVVVGAGVVPNTQFLADTPVTLDRGYVVVDPVGRTNVPGVFAIGDVAATLSPGDRQPKPHGHWQASVNQALAVAHLIANEEAKEPPPAYVWTEQFDHVIQLAGSPEPSMTLHKVPLSSGDVHETSGFSVQPYVALYTRNGVIESVLGFNAKRHFARAKKLLGEVFSEQDVRRPDTKLGAVFR